MLKTLHEAGFAFRIQKRSLSLWLPQIRERVALIFVRNDCQDRVAWSGFDRPAWEFDPGAPEVTLASCAVRQESDESDPALALSPEEEIAYLHTPCKMPSPSYPRILLAKDVAPTVLTLLTLSHQLEKGPWFGSFWETPTGYRWPSVREFGKIQGLLPCTPLSDSRARAMGTVGNAVGAIAFLQPLYLLHCGLTGEGGSPVRLEALIAELL